jgi:hypothetical protein
MGEDTVEWSRDMVEVERLDEEAGVPDLAPSAAAQEPVKLLLDGAVPPRRHLLERAKPVEIVVGPKDLLDPRRTERAYQLLFQIRDAHEEAEPLHIRARQPGAEAGALQCPPEDRLLAGIAKTREPQAVPACTEALEELPDAMSASEAIDANPRGCKVDAPPLGERFDCDLVTLPLDDQYGAQFDPVGYHVDGGHGEASRRPRCRRQIEAS